MDIGNAIFKTAKGPSVDVRTSSQMAAYGHRVGSLTANDSQVGVASATSSGLAA